MSGGNQTVKVPFVNLGAEYLLLRDRILDRVDEISRRGSYVLGAEVKEFERAFADYCGVNHAIAVGNGSDALILALWIHGVGAGDEVIIPPNSFVATAWAVARTGATIVFADVGEDMNLDPAKVREAVTPRTKVIMPVHLTGRIARMDEITNIAEEHGVMVLEDAAQAVGAKRGGRRAGSFGWAAGFSLHPLKNLHVQGDGGVCVTNDGCMAEEMRKYRNHGLRNRDECEFWGVNTRLDTIQAAIALLKLPHLDKWNARNREIATRYREALGDRLSVPGETAGEEPVYHRFMVCHPHRDRLAQALAEQGVETRVNYPLPLHLHQAAADLGYQRGDFPRAEELAATILSLPLYHTMTDEQVDCVIEAVRDAA
jgi:dTDP-4-amino-4,6-dideoxygalactose transaminase